jgi:hypothetical protein
MPVGSEPKALTPFLFMDWSQIPYRFMVSGLSSDYKNYGQERHYHPSSTKKTATETDTKDFPAQPSCEPDGFIVRL